MRFLITGANGLLGSRLAELSAKSGHDVFSGYNKLPQKTDSSSITQLQLNITSEPSIKEAFSISKPDVVFHCAALTDVDRCEVERDLAIKVNCEGSGLVASHAAKYSSHLLYVSTDYVFSGARGNYNESDPTDPINHYGYSKLLGEHATSSSGAPCLIARASVIYGSRPANGKVNFALWLIESLKSGKPVSLLTDQYVSPTLNTNLAEMLIEAAERRLTGLYHMSGATSVTRYEFGIHLARSFSLDASLVSKASLANFEGKWKAKRPADSSLDVSKASSILSHKPLPLNHALRELKKEIDKEKELEFG